MTDPVTLPRVDVDALAQEIRRVDGSRSLGAGALAEALMPFLARQSLASAPQVGGEDFDSAKWNVDQPIGDGTYLFRTTLTGERHLVETATGFVRVKLPYDYRFTDNATQHADAKAILAALSQEAEPVAKPVRWGPCSECGGSGVQPAFMSRSRECSRCDGSGSIVHPNDRGGEVKG